MASLGQAVVIDALIFLMICGFASASLLWASSVYGDTSFNAFIYLYLNDYETSSLILLSEIEYNDYAGVSRAWMIELGEFMIGTFNETDPPKRYKNLTPAGELDSFIEVWEEICRQAPAPLLLSVFSNSRGVKRGTPEEPLYFGCGTLLELEDGSRGVLYEELDNNKFLLNPTKYPYYASGVQSRTCGIVRCEMVTYVYY